MAEELGQRPAADPGEPAAAQVSGTS
jgi:hypothetical protein